MFVDFLPRRGELTVLNFSPHICAWLYEVTSWSLLGYYSSSKRQWAKANERTKITNENNLRVVERYLSC